MTGDIYLSHYGTCITRCNTVSYNRKPCTFHSTSAADSSHQPPNLEQQKYLAALDQHKFAPNNRNVEL